MNQVLFEIPFIPQHCKDIKDENIEKVTWYFDLPQTFLNLRNQVTNSIIAAIFHSYIPAQEATIIKLFGGYQRLAIDLVLKNSHMTINLLNVLFYTS